MLSWQEGPFSAPIGNSLAIVEVPEGYLFLDKANTQTLLELTENPLTGQEMATLAPASDDENWFGCRSDIYNGVNNLQAHYRWYVTDCF